MKKIDCAKKLINEHIDIFSCPICTGNFLNLNDNSIKCQNNHGFDLSKNGYINLLTSNKLKVEYSKELFEARNKICKKGLFSKATKLIEEIILNYSNSLNEVMILDAGCGEGSNLSEIMNSLDLKLYKAVGLDISKEAIFIASKEYQNIIWTVGDLSNTPFKEKSFNIILNILSPSNYGEFKRLLKENGILIKIVPNELHLHELREIIYEKTDKENYSNEQVVQHFNDKFKLIDVKDISYKFKITDEDLLLLIRMTPLAWKITEDMISKIIKSNLNEITIDMSLMIGRAL